MKPVRFTPHAMQNLQEREISLAEVERTVAEPDAIASGHEGRDIYMRRYFDATLNQEMLLRVVAEETESEIVVVTAYKVSRIERYLRRTES